MGNVEARILDKRDYVERREETKIIPQSQTRLFLEGPKREERQFHSTWEQTDERFYGDLDQTGKRYVGRQLLQRNILLGGDLKQNGLRAAGLGQYGITVNNDLHQRGLVSTGQTEQKITVGGDAFQSDMTALDVRGHHEFRNHIKGTLDWRNAFLAASIVSLQDLNIEGGLVTEDAGEGRTPYLALPHIYADRLAWRGYVAEEWFLNRRKRVIRETASLGEGNEWQLATLLANHYALKEVIKPEVERAHSQKWYDKLKGDKKEAKRLKPELEQRKRQLESHR